MFVCAILQYFSTYMYTIEYLYNLKEFVLNFNFFSSLDNPV